MNNNKKLFTALSIICFLAGMLFFFLYQEWLVISWHRPYSQNETASPLIKKTVMVGRKKNNEWVQESVQILWSEDQKETLKTITNAWLSWLEDEGVLSKKIVAESVLFSPSGYEMYISFDHNPFDKHWSIHHKESFINALLKSYKENGCTVSSFYFLVHHEPLKDSHLDFNEPWNFSNFL